MSHRTSLAGVDELKYSFEQANINTQDNTYIRNTNTYSHVGEISDEDDSDKSDISFLNELSGKQRSNHTSWHSYISKRNPSSNSICFSNFRLLSSSVSIGVGTILIDDDCLFWKRYGCDSNAICLCWEMSRVKDIHFFMQPQGVPYCAIEFFSDHLSPSHFDSFLFSQDCTDEINTTIACQELARLKQALSTAYAAIKNNQQKYLQHLVKNYVLYSSSHQPTSYIEHIRNSIQSISHYPLPNPSTLLPSSISSSQVPDKKEQQRILLPYKQSLMATLNIQEELKNHRSQTLGITVNRVNHPDRMAVWEYRDSVTQQLITEENYIRKWKEVKEEQSQKHPFEVELESELTKKYYKNLGVTNRPGMDEVISPPAPKRMSNPLTSPPRVRTKPEEGSQVKSRIVVREIPPSPHETQCSVNPSTIKDMFEVYINEMEMRKKQYENEMNQITQNYYQDLDKITNQFLSVLENQGVDSSVLEQLLSSL